MRVKIKIKGKHTFLEKTCRKKKDRDLFEQKVFHIIKKKTKATSVAKKKVDKIIYYKKT